MDLRTTRAHVARNVSAATPAHQLDHLFAQLDQADLPTRTRRLVQASVDKKAKKLVEEAAEVALDAAQGSRRGVVQESADLLYHLAVLWHEMGVRPDEVWAEMEARAEAYGIAQKLEKSLAKPAPAAKGKPTPKAKKAKRAS
ncbi:MAG: phosphoribosyl-ATP diphosphatase [Geminicoccaceae bacterium]|nr:MAG: phosphoribosyl-ATP diphosphatase [Geminicoccaceae bacterium]